MRITAIEAIPLAVPDPPLRNSWGVHAPLQRATWKFPPAPGLGVTLDEGRVGEYREAFQRGVVRQRDDTAELIKRQPGWLPIKPKW